MEWQKSDDITIFDKDNISDSSRILSSTLAPKSHISNESMKPTTQTNKMIFFYLKTRLRY